MNRTILLLCLSIPSLASALPIEIIREKGEYLKGLVSTVKLDQFLKDSSTFFEFDPEFPPTVEAMNTYKIIADELVEHAKVTRAEKFEERKLLLGTTIHNSRALIKASFCAPITVATAGASLFCIIVIIQRRHKMFVPIAALASGLIATGFGFLTKRYWRRAVNHGEIIAQEMQMLNTIIDHCKKIQKQMSERNIATPTSGVA